jgi:hypothetical protein
MQNLPRFTVIDSLELRSLNSTIYHVDDVYAFDDNRYYIIRDNLTTQFFTMVKSSWFTFNCILDEDLQIIILENGSDGRTIKPVNYELIGLESYLNNCRALESRALNPNTVDTILKFYAEELIRLTQPYQVDSIIDSNNSNYSAPNKREYKKNNERKRILLKKKIQRQNVLVYDSYGGLIYVEINPGRNLYDIREQGYDPPWLHDDQFFYPIMPSGNNYCLVYARLI